MTEPREHCGHLSPETGLSAVRTECVLRPGHSGSHADEVGCRWWPITDTPAAPAGPAPATDRAGVAAVRALHQPMERGPFTICAHCSGWDGKWRCLGVVTDYPCPTLRALDGEQATVLPAPDQQTAVLSDRERGMLGFALEMAQEEIYARSLEFTDEDRAALERLRRLAGETQQDEVREAADYARALATPPSAEAAAYIRDRLAERAREAQQDERCAHPHGRPGIASLMEHVGINTSGGVTVDGRTVAAPCTCGGRGIHHLHADDHQPAREAQQDPTQDGETP
jgi:hypothetical protein